MHRVLLIDDEPAANKALKRVLESFDEVEVIGCYHNPYEGKEAIVQMLPDIVFLDIEMPELNGFDIAAATEHIPYHLVYVTAYPKHALTAFETKVVDYMLKPVRQTRLERCLEKVKKLHRQLPTKPVQEISINDGKRTYRLLPKDISYIESIGRYQQINLTELAKKNFQIETIVTQNSMASFESKLGSTQFLRVHRSYIVNLELLLCVHKEERNTFVSLLNVAKSIPIARSKVLLISDYLN